MLVSNALVYCGKVDFTYQFFCKIACTLMQVFSLAKIFIFGKAGIHQTCFTNVISIFLWQGGSYSKFHNFFTDLPIFTSVNLVNLLQYFVYIFYKNKSVKSQFYNLKISKFGKNRWKNKKLDDNFSNAKN